MAEQDLDMVIALNNLAADRRDQKMRECGCSRCIAPDECPTCHATGQLCRECEAHYLALADSYDPRHD